MVKDSYTPGKRAFIVVTLAWVAAIGAAPLTAQVGHSPGGSPYRDLRVRHLLSLQTGFLGGGGGKAGVGPVDGPMVGARFDVYFGGPLVLVLGLGVANLDRLIINPNEGPANRTLGMAKQRVVVGDIGFNWMFTGSKTWHGIAPYFGATMGLAAGGRVPEDSSQFEFGTKFQIGPQIGVRFHPGGRLSFRFEARDIIWRLSYPAIFFADPINATGEEPVLDARITKNNQWTHVPALIFSVGYAIRI